jgi:hypothetical protein
MKNLINQYVHGAQLSAVASGVKGESLPAISSFSGKGNVSAGVVKFATGPTFSIAGIKEGKTAVLASDSLLKADKGAAAASKAASKGKVTVKGGLVPKKKGIKKTNIAGIASKIAKYTPTGKKTSVARLGPKAIATPSDGSAAGTTKVKSMKDFKKLVEWHKAQKKRN